MASTRLHHSDIVALLQGKVLYRTNTGAPANPPTGEHFDGRYAVEMAINPEDLEGLRQLIEPKFWNPPFIATH